MPTLFTYENARVIAPTANGTAVEGQQLESFARAYLEDDINKAIRHIAARVKNKARRVGVKAYAHQHVWLMWVEVANLADRHYTNSPRPGEHGHQTRPVGVYEYSVDARRVAAYYLERRYRIQVADLAGLTLTDEQRAESLDEQAD